MTETDIVPVERELPPYFAVSLFKFAVLSICTFGFYDLWWFYVNWCRIRQREQSDIWPAWRAILAIIWCYACLCRIRSTAVSMNVPAVLPAGPLTVAWIVTELLYKLPDPWGLLCLLSIVWLLPAQMVANRVNRAAVPDHNPNTSFSGWNWAAITIGGIILVLAIIGAFLPPR
ncbi:MAG: hypothetical protein JWN16_2705 [Alphaproteobacteria bacterium]|nr:hypothetical protein [Alphaproteobacteria bacterium]